MCKSESLNSHLLKIKNNQLVAPKHTHLLGKKRMKQRKQKWLIMYEDDNTLLVVYHCSLLLKEFSPRTLTKATCYPCHVVFMLDVKSRGLGYHIIFNKIVYIYFSGHEHMLHSTKWFF